jgi:predicted nucleotidyltransferase
MITFSRGEELFGYNASALRMFTAYVSDGLIPLKSIMDRLFIKTKKDYSKVINTLIDNGYIISEKTRGVFVRNGDCLETSYTITDKGRELCRARCVKRMNKAQADKLFNGILERIKEVNDNPYYLYKVKDIVLFGSYITDKEDFGDIDIAFDLQFKRRVFKTKNGLNSELVANINRANENNFFHSLYKLSFAEKEVEKFLKNRKAQIHITPYSHIKPLNTETKTISVESLIR